jgi:CRISPR-associated protein Cas1
MRLLLNTLYVMTQGSYVNLDHETVKIRVDENTKLQVPLHHLGAIVCMGNIRVSSGIMAKCAADGRGLTMLDDNGRFLWRVEGPVSGNVLLRYAQHQAINDVNKTVAIAKNIVAGKIQNCRQVVLRGAREADCKEDVELLRQTSTRLASVLNRLKSANDIEVIRGLEGEAARSYFLSFECLIKADRVAFYFKRRSRRPPRDRCNALLSFLYTIIGNDYISALEGVGLDPQVGYLHALRSGKAALGLDLMEELRPLLADRLSVTLINRRQVVAEDFDKREGGAVYLSTEGRKKVVVAYQNRKKDEIMHPLLDRKIPIGLIPHVQARLLARFLRGDTETYIPFVYK